MLRPASKWFGGLKLTRVSADLSWLTSSIFGPSENAPSGSRRNERLRLIALSMDARRRNGHWSDPGATKPLTILNNTASNGRRAMKSPVVKRSIVIAGHKTSVSLEDAFWRALKEIAITQRLTLSDLVGSIEFSSVSTATCLPPSGCSFSTTSRGGRTTMARQRARLAPRSSWHQWRQFCEPNSKSSGEWIAGGGALGRPRRD